MGSKQLILEPGKTLSITIPLKIDLVALREKMDSDVIVLKVPVTLTYKKED